MNYFLNEHFLYTSPNVTSISVSFDETLTEGTAAITIVSNKRECAIRFNGDVPYSYFKDNPHFKIRDLEGLFVEMDVQQLKTTADTVINGIRYYSSNEIDSLSVSMVDGIDTVKSIVKDEYVNVLVPSSDITANQYCSGINNLKLGIYCEVVDESQFVISNINTVQMDRVNKFNVHNTYIPTFNEFALTEDRIISEFIDAMKTSRYGEFDDYEICASLSDIVSRTQKHKWLVVTGHMADPLSELYSTHVRIHPKYGHYCQVVISLSLEWIFDDFSTFQYERDNLIVGNKWDDFTCYAITDPAGDEWKYSVDWNFIHKNGWDNEVRRSPVGKYLSDKPLYSIVGECKIIGWMLEKLDGSVGRIEETRLQTYMSVLNKEGTAVILDNTAFKILAEIYRADNPRLDEYRDFYVYELELEVDGTQFVCLGKKNQILKKLSSLLKENKNLIGDGVVIVASDKEVDKVMEEMSVGAKPTERAEDRMIDRVIARTSNHSLHVANYNNYNLLMYSDNQLIVCKRKGGKIVLEEATSDWTYPYPDPFVEVDIRGKLPPYFSGTRR